MFTGLDRTIRSLGGVLHTSDDKKRIFEKPPRVSFRRPKHLKDKLIRSTIKSIEGYNKGMKKCGEARYQICNFVKEGNTFCDNTGKVYHVNYGFDCDSKGVIYLLKCDRFRKRYVGSTINPFRKGLTIIREVYLGMEREKRVYRVSIYIRTFLQKAK